MLDESKNAIKSCKVKNSYEVIQKHEVINCYELVKNYEVINFYKVIKQYKSKIICLLYSRKLAKSSNLI